MKYVGSKRRLAPHILPLMLRGRMRNQYWVEPFVGGCNMIDKVDGLRIGSDKQTLLIAMWKALQLGWVPPHIVTESMYYAIRANPDAYPPELVCFVGYCCSFGSKWWGGYARDGQGGLVQNYARESSRHIMKQVPKLMDVDFQAVDYRKLVIPPRSIIYCDPPYRDTLGYKSLFNHSAFWLWVRRMEKEGHRVYVSEYDAPPDFVCLKEIYMTSSMDHDYANVRAEKLFRYCGS